jgi:hypothetical protein
MEKGCDKVLRRVRRYDTFLAEMDCRRRLVCPDDMADAPVGEVTEITERPNTSTHRHDHSISIGTCCSGEHPSVWPLGMSTTPCSGTDGKIVKNLPAAGCVGGSSRVCHHHQQYIIEGRHGPVVKYTSPNSEGTKIRNNRFQRFVAAKQHRRERALKSSGSTTTPACENSIKERHQQDVRDLSTQENQQHESFPLDSSPGNAEESPNHKTDPLSPMETERNDIVREEDLSFLQNPLTRSNDSPTSVMEMSDAQFFVDSSRSDAVPQLVAPHPKSTQKYLFVRVESNPNLKCAMKQPSNNESQKQTNKLTWWDDEDNKHKCSHLKSDASCDVVDDVGCFYCVDRIQELSLEQKNADAHEKNLPNDTPILGLLRGENIISDCTSNDWCNNTLGTFFGSRSGKKLSPMQELIAQLDCFSLNVDDGASIPIADKRKVTRVSTDDASLCDSEATPPTSNTSFCGSYI